MVFRFESLQRRRRFRYHWFDVQGKCELKLHFVHRKKERDKTNRKQSQCVKVKEKSAKHIDGLRIHSTNVTILITHRLNMNVLIWDGLALGPNHSTPFLDVSIYFCISARHLECCNSLKLNGMRQNRFENIPFHFTFEFWFFVFSSHRVIRRQPTMYQALNHIPFPRQSISPIR